MADRSRSRSPPRDDDNAPAHDESRGDDVPHDNGAGGGGVDEEVKLYVGNLDYGEFQIFENSIDIHLLVIDHDNVMDVYQ